MRLGRGGREVASPHRGERQVAIVEGGGTWGPGRVTDREPGEERRRAGPGAAAEESMPREGRHFTASLPAELLRGRRR